MNNSFSNRLAEQYSKNKKIKLSTSDIQTLYQLFINWQYSVSQGISTPLTESLLEISCQKSSPSNFWKKIDHLDKLTQAWIIGTASHSAEIDDSEFIGETHPSTVIFSALAPLLEEKTTLTTFLKHAYTGYQTIFSVGRQVNPEHYRRGWHGTSTVGTYGAYAAAASHLNLSKNQFLNGLSFCTNQISGLHSSYGTEIKPMNAGNASRVGLLSALLAKKNITGKLDSFDCKYGFFEMYGLNNTQQKQLKTQSLNLVKLKKYPTCHCTHPFIEAALKIHPRISINNIKKIIIYGSKYALDMIDKPAPKTISDARFSVQYCVYYTLKHGQLQMKHFSAKYINTAKYEYDIETKMVPSFEEMEAKLSIYSKNGDIVESKYNLSRT